MNSTVSLPTPSLEKMIRSPGSYFFRNSASRKPNSEIILHFFFLSVFLYFTQVIGVWEGCVASKVYSLDRRTRRRSCGWKRLLLLGLACAELGVFGVTGTNPVGLATQIFCGWKIRVSFGTIWQCFPMPCHSRITPVVIILQLELHKKDRAMMQYICKYTLSYVMIPWAVHVQVLARS